MSTTQRIRTIRMADTDAVEIRWIDRASRECVGISRVSMDSEEARQVDGEMLHDAMNHIRQMEEALGYEGDPEHSVFDRINELLEAEAALNEPLPASDLLREFKILLHHATSGVAIHPESSVAAWARSVIAREEGAA